MAEHNSVMKGVNLPPQWQAKVLRLMTDLACVHRWISNTLTGKALGAVNAASEILLGRRHGTLVDVISEYVLSVYVILDKSDENNAVQVIRVPQ